MEEEEEEYCSLDYSEYFSSHSHQVNKRLPVTLDCDESNPGCEGLLCVV